MLDVIRKKPKVQQ